MRKLFALLIMTLGLTQVYATTIPSFQSAGATGNGTASVTPGIPATTGANSIWILVAEGTGTVVAPNANWTRATNGLQQAGTTPATSSGLSVFWHRYDGSTDPGRAIPDAGDHIAAQIFSFSGCITTGDPFNNTFGNTITGSGTTGRIYGSTPTVTNTMTFVVCTSTADTSSTSNYSSWTNANLASPSITECGDFNTTSGNGGGFGVAYGGRAAASTMGISVVTYAATPATSNKAFFCGSLTPAADPPPSSGVQGSVLILQ